MTLKCLSGQKEVRQDGGCLSCDSDAGEACRIPAQLRAALWPGNPPGLPDKATQDAMIDRVMQVIKQADAIIGDISRPMRKALAIIAKNDIVTAIEMPVLKAIYEAAGLDWDGHKDARIRTADNGAMYAERRDLFTEHKNHVASASAFDLPVIPWEWRTAEKELMAAFISYFPDAQGCVR